MKYIVISAATLGFIHGQENMLDQVQKYPELDINILDQLTALVDKKETATDAGTDKKEKIWKKPF